VTLKSGLGVAQGRWKWHSSIDHIRLTIGIQLYLVWKGSECSNRIRRANFLLVFRNPSVLLSFRWPCDRQRTDDGQMINRRRQHILNSGSSISTFQWYTSVLCSVFSFRACRASDNGGNHIFTLDTCQLTGQVINIHSAEIGFSKEWKDDENPPKCLGKTTTCRRLTEHDEVWKFCDGKRNCSFSQNILNYTLCPNSKNENFISISYNCINGMCAWFLQIMLVHCYSQHHAYVPSGFR